MILGGYFFVGPPRPFRELQAAGISGLDDSGLPFSLTQKRQSRSLLGFITRGLGVCPVPFFFLRKRRSQFPCKRRYSSKQKIRIARITSKSFIQRTFSPSHRVKAHHFIIHFSNGVINYGVRLYPGESVRALIRRGSISPPWFAF
jgi:hypothetical protein